VLLDEVPLVTRVEGDTMSALPLNWFATRNERMAEALSLVVVLSMPNMVLGLIGIADTGALLDADSL